MLIYRKDDGTFVASQFSSNERMVLDFKSRYSEEEYYIVSNEKPNDPQCKDPDRFTYDGEEFIEVEGWDDILAARNSEAEAVALSNRLAQTVEATKSTALNLFKSEIQAIKNNYDDDEIKSWEQQRTEAIAWSADNSAEVPLITSMAAAREFTIEELVTKINSNVAAYEATYGAALGKKQKHYDSISDIVNSDSTEQEKIDALNALDIT